MMVEVDKPILLMTGSSGLLGSRLVKEFTQDYAIIGFDMAEPPEPDLLEEFFKCDLTSTKSVKAALAAVREQYGNRIASVIHLAAYYDFSGKSSPLYEELTVQGTGRMLRELQEFDVGQFIFSSTLLVMEPRDDDDAPPLTEHSQTRGEWAYPASKLETEALLRAEHGRIPVVVLRLAGVYDEEGHSLPLSQHIRRIYEKKIDSLFFPGDKDHGQPFVHLDDLCACFRNAVEKRTELSEYEMFLIAEPDIVNQGELQNMIGEYIHGRNWPSIRIPKPAAKLGAWAKDKLTQEEQFIKPWMIDLADHHYPVEISSAQERLGWKPQHRLRDTIEEIIENLKRDPKAWYERHKLPKPDKKELLQPQRRAS